MHVLIWDIRCRRRWCLITHYCDSTRRLSDIFCTLKGELCRFVVQQTRIPWMYMRKKKKRKSPGGNDRVFSGLLVTLCLYIPNIGRLLGSHWPPQYFAAVVVTLYYRVVVCASGRYSPSVQIQTDRHEPQARGESSPRLSGGYTAAAAAVYVRHCGMRMACQLFPRHNRY